MARIARGHRLADVIGAFHSRCERNPQIAAEGSRDKLRGRWTDSFDQVRAFHGSVLDPQIAAEVERLALRYLAGRERLLADRADRGFVVDGHGDLLADDIFCLPDGPRILDCLEFDDRLRYLDQLDDAAFLGLDLEWLGAPELAARFLGWYVEFTGDPAPASLLHHYLAYRAFVRAKIGCLRHQQGDLTAAGEARALTRITHRHLATAAVVLVFVGGLPGTGKSSPVGWPTSSAACCSAATGYASSSPASARSNPPRRPTGKGSTPGTEPSGPTPSSSPEPRSCSRSASPWCSTTSRFSGCSTTAVRPAPADRSAASTV